MTPLRFIRSVLLVGIAYGAPCFHVGGSLFQGVPLVDTVFSFTQGNLNFDFAVVEIDLERNEGLAFFLNFRGGLGQ